MLAALLYPAGILSDIPSADLEIDALAARLLTVLEAHARGLPMALNERLNEAATLFPSTLAETTLAETTLESVQAFVSAAAAALEAFDAWRLARA